MSTENKCPVCGDGELRACVELEDAEYRGAIGKVELHYSVCSACGSEQAGADQARMNKRSMLAFKKQVDGLLTGEEIKSLRARWNISQSQAAEIFGGGPVAFSKYENDDVAQSEAMDKLLKVAAHVPAAFGWLADYAKVEINKNLVNSLFANSFVRAKSYTTSFLTYSTTHNEQDDFVINSHPIAAANDDMGEGLAYG